MTLQFRSSLLPGLTVLLCLAVNGWPAAAQQATSKPPSGGKTVCVVSVVGHKFDVKTIGVMVFGNKLESAPIGSWGIDDLIARKVSTVLGRQFAVKRIAAPPAPLAAYKQLASIFNDRDRGLIAALRTSGKGCRYFVVATPISGQLPGTNQYLDGLGIFKRSGIISNYVLFAAFTVQLYDGQSFERIRAPYDTPAFVDALFTPSWMRMVDESWWPGSAQAAARNPKLRDATRALVSKVLDREVPRLLPVLTRPTE